MSDQKKSGVILLAQADIGTAQVGLQNDAPPAEAFAAEELTRCLCVMSGATPGSSRMCGTRIVLNDTAAAEAVGIRPGRAPLGPEDFHIESCGAELHILGGSPRGVLYGAYELLERLGCRWFTPEVESIPRRECVTLDPIRLTGGPAFEFRDLHGSPEGDELWRARNRFNGHCRPLPEKLGGYEGYGLWVHTFYELVPPAEFFADHPEYFSMIQGVRRHEGAQLCLTNPAVLNIVTERVLARMRALPHARYFSVSSNDWFNPCDCPDCRRAVAETGAQAGPLLRFVNAVAERTSREFPDRVIDTLAYQYTVDAPCGVTAHPNVQVRLCPIFCCQTHPYGTCDHPESRRFLEAFRQWAPLVSRLSIWHYFPNFAHGPLPMPNFDELTGNARLYLEAGVRGLFWQGETNCESAPLRRYLMARLAWDPLRDPWVIVDEWLAGMFGPAAAAALRPYYDLFHDRARLDRTLCANCICPPSAPLFNDATLAEAGRILEAARPACRTEGAKAYRDSLALGVAYGRLCRKPGQFRVEGERYRGDATAEDLAEFDRLAPALHEAGANVVRFGEDFAVLRARLLSHPVLRLAHDDQSVVAVPALGGRLVEWHAAGRQWLSPADPDDDWTAFPFNGGYMESPSVAGGGRAADLSALTGAIEENTLAVRADLGLGATSERIVRLADAGLDVDTTLRNGGVKPVEAGWGGSWRLHAPDFTEVRIDTGAGEIVIRVAELEDGLARGRILMLDNVAQVSWTVRFPSTRVLCVCESVGLKQVIVGRNVALGLLAVDFRVAAGTLPAGTDFRIVQRLRIT